MSISPRTSALAVAAALVLAACPDAAPDRSMGERGGTVVFGVLGEPATLDPYSRVASDLTYALVRPLYPSLWRLLPDGTTEPYLARSLEKAGPRSVRVMLREARWSSGRPITADDVAASIARARAPSGFSRVERVRVEGVRTLVLGGKANGWRRTLATLAFVMPRGRPSPRVSGGPLRLVSRRPGLELVYERNDAWWGQASLDRLVVRFVERLEIMLGLLEEGRLDAAAPPSSVNLEERLAGMGIESDERVGWDSIYLDLEGSALSSAYRAGIAAAIDRRLLGESFIRDSGRASSAMQPRPGSVPAGAVLRLAAPVGDELLDLLQRAIQLQLWERDVTAELVHADVRTFYGRWATTDPMDAALRRAAGAPGLRRLRPGAHFPLFDVASLVAWRPGVHGPRANPTVEGPLWNAQSWWKETEG